MDTGYIIKNWWKNPFDVIKDGFNMLFDENYEMVNPGNMFSPANPEVQTRSILNMDTNTLMMLLLMSGKGNNNDMMMMFLLMSMMGNQTPQTNQNTQSASIFSQLFDLFKTGFGNTSGGTGLAVINPLLNFGANDTQVPALYPQGVKDPSTPDFNKYWQTYPENYL